MLLRRFDLHRPRTLDGAFELLDRFGEDATLYAGGTELLIALKARVLHYQHLIDLKGVAGLPSITEDETSIGIGALATHLDIARNPIVRSRLRAYAELSDNIANIRVRAAGTLGGNLCFAEPHADPPALLAAMGAVLRLESGSGQRECPMAEFIEGDFETKRRPDEILTEIRIPKPAPNLLAAYRSFGAGERPAAGAAVALTLEGDVCSRAELWIGALAGRPMKLIRASDAAVGIRRRDLPSTLRELVTSEIAEIQVSDDAHGTADYKRHLAKVMVERATQGALAEASND